jgi:hypothetical protein
MEKSISNKYFIAALLSLFTIHYSLFTVSAQRINHINLDLHSGVYFPDLKDLNAEFMANYNQDFGKTIITVGGSFAPNLSLQLGKRATSSYDQIAFNSMLPKEVIVDDSLSFTLKGYQLTLCFTAIDFFPRSKFFDLVLGVGTSFGRMRIDRLDLRLDSERHKYTNPYMASKIIIEPTIYLWRIVLGVRAEYMIDYSSGSWKYKDNRLPPIATAKSSGFMVQGILGFNLAGDQ